MINPAGEFARHREAAVFEYRSFKRADLSGGSPLTNESGGGLNEEDQYTAVSIVIATP
jgi:hypothetical protein